MNSKKWYSIILFLDGKKLGHIKSAKAFNPFTLKGYYKATPDWVDETCKNFRLECLKEDLKSFKGKGVVTYEIETK